MKSIIDTLIYVGSTTHKNVSKNIYQISKKVVFIARVRRKNKSISCRGGSIKEALVKLDKRLIKLGYEPIYLKKCK